MVLHPQAVKKIAHSIYVDDIAFAEQLAYRLYSDAKAILREGGFNLRKFVTNANELREKIEKSESALPSSSVSYTGSTLGTTQPLSAGETKVLGVKWNPSIDCLVFDLSETASLAPDLEPTKRNVIGIACRFYDPVGFVAPEPESSGMKHLMLIF